MHQARLRFTRANADRPRTLAVSRHSQSIRLLLSPVWGTPLVPAVLSLSVFVSVPGAGAAVTMKVAVVWPLSYTKVRVCVPCARLFR